MGPRRWAKSPRSLPPQGAGVPHLPGNQAGLGVDVQGREPLHDLKDIHRLRHPRVEEADVSVDAAERVTVTPGRAGPQDQLCGGCPAPKAPSEGPRRHMRPHPG